MPGLLNTPYARIISGSPRVAIRNPRPPQPDSTAEPIPSSAKPFNRYIEPSTRLDYHAGVKFHQMFKVDDKTFNDVHVVTLTLTFAQDFAATQTERMRFEKKRMVVLDAAGKVLHISGDGTTEVPIMAI
jgi:hypothetical protein